jgi:hypothetical protein
MRLVRNSASETPLPNVFSCSVQPSKASAGNSSSGLWHKQTTTSECFETWSATSLYKPFCTCPGSPHNNSINVVIHPFPERGETIGVGHIHVLPDTIHTDSPDGRVRNVDLRHFLRDCQYECETYLYSGLFLSYRLQWHSSLRFWSWRRKAPWLSRLYWVDPPGKYCPYMATE